VAQGGYQRPSNPAPVSGPGALSKRTDGQPIRVPTGMPYGEAGALEQLQRSAPLAASPGGNTPVPPGAAPSQGAANVTPFGAPTQQPATPVTAGAALGPGPGTDALGLPNPPSDDMQALMNYLPVLEFMANQPGASAAARNLVRDLKSRQA
jgi:hypothetical protein